MEPIHCSYKPQIPGDSPVPLTPKPINNLDDVEEAILNKREKDFFNHRNSLEVRSYISLGDSLLHVVSSIKDDHDLKLVIRYLLHSTFRRMGEWSMEVVVEEALGYRRERLMKGIEVGGGFEHSTRVKLEAIFPASGTQYEPKDQQALLESAEELEVEVRKYQEICKLIKYVEKKFKHIEKIGVDK